MDWLDPTLRLATLPTRPFKALCPIPDDLDAVTSIGPESDPADADTTHHAVDSVFDATRKLYATGLYPAVQVCIRRRGVMVLNRALGFASGGGPGSAESERTPVTTETPFRIYSASKAITAMVVHLLDDRGVLHIDDRVCDYLPEFRRPDKEQITLAHVLAHRAGIANVPPGVMELDLLSQPEEIIRLIADIPLRTRPGRRLAYHAVTGGFVLGEVVRRAVGQDIRHVLRKEIAEPMGLRWTSYGVPALDVNRVAEDAVTGMKPFPGLSPLFKRALGVGFEEAVTMASDPRFMAGIAPSANGVSTAEELCAFYQCLLDDGEHAGKKIFEPRTVHRATVEQSYWEIDLTLGAPLRYGLGFMLGQQPVSLFGWDAPHAFGHLGFTNIFSWADPERDLSAAIVTSGKPFMNVEMLRLLSLIFTIGRVFPKIVRG
ncbi:MAG: beta-lactamase family protein [Deltaproteobacteria bacterium]|nr:beta-lactamase family protein [Deltaproteobacteria bacterium]MBW2448513.1 beta-lactamase family protein [Deltaproteobacteria bacterium]